MPMKKTIEIKKDEKGFGTLYVNDEPFLILGGELHMILCQEKVQIKNDFFPSCQHT